MEHTCNIVDLIEHNPITKLSNTYQNKLLMKIKHSFSDIEQQLFVSSFYCFLNYNQRTDFVIDLDNIWGWLGFSQKDAAKRTIEKHFAINTDYKIFAPQVGGAIRGGHNKEIIMLTVRTFKLFCLKAGTKKSEQIHEYYIKLEETLQSVIQEESDELKLQLETKTIELKNKENDSDKVREKTILEQFQNNTQCFYYGIVDNVSENNEKLIKFGNSNNLKSRVIRHKETYSNFCLINAFKVDNKLQIENAFKENVVFNERIRTITIKSKKYIELLNINGLSFTELNKIIKNIIMGIEYSPENYIKILEENNRLKMQLDKSNNTQNTNNTILLTSENKQLKIDNLKLIKKITSLQNTHIPDAHVDAPEIDNYRVVANSFDKMNRKITKNKDGVYIVNGVEYIKLRSSRQDVWDGIAYQTTGGINKNGLLINKNGKITSKKKSIYEMNNNKFFIHGVNKGGS